MTKKARLSGVSIGDRVGFRFGTSHMHGVVIEDRGPIGANKIRLYSIQVDGGDVTDDEPTVIEMPEDEIIVLGQNDVGVSSPLEKVIFSIPAGTRLTTPDGQNRTVERPCLVVDVASSRELKALMKDKAPTPNVRDGLLTTRDTAGRNR